VLERLKQSRRSCENVSRKANPCHEEDRKQAIDPIETWFDLRKMSMAEISAASKFSSKLRNVICWSDAHLQLRILRKCIHYTKTSGNAGLIAVRIYMLLEWDN